MEAPAKVEASTKGETKSKKAVAAEKRNKIPVAKGIPKSGRVWKSSSKRASSLNVGKAYNHTWEKKKAEKEKLKQLKEKERALKEDAQQKKDQAKQEAEERRKRKEENEKNSSVVQKITDTRKLKKMKRSQLKLIEKR